MLITLIVGLCLNSFNTCCALTLGHFSPYNRPSLSFLFLPFLQVIQSFHSLGVFISCFPYHSKKFQLLSFVLKRQRAPLLKAVMISASHTARPPIGEPIAPTYSSPLDQPTKRSKVCQVKTAVLQGSSSSIETLEGI